MWPSRCLKSYYSYWCWRQIISTNIGTWIRNKHLIFDLYPPVCCWCVLTEELDISGWICVVPGLRVPTLSWMCCQVEGGVGGLPSPVNLSTACHVAVPPRCLTAGTQALCRCLIIVSQRHAAYCQTIHLFFSAALALDTFPASLYSSSYLLLCDVPVRAYRRTNDNGAELSDCANCGIICINSFWVVDSLAGGMSDNLQLFVYSRVSTRVSTWNYLPHTFSSIWRYLCCTYVYIFPVCILKLIIFPWFPLKFVLNIQKTLRKFSNIHAFK